MSPPTQHFMIPGEPKGKMRPRASFHGGHGRVHDAPEQVSNENWVKVCARDAGIGLMDSAVAATIVVTVVAPKSLTKAKRAAIDGDHVLPAKKPDLDNVAKLVLDALNGIAYKDDAQVVDLRVSRRYGPAAQVEVWLTERGPLLDQVTG